MIDYIDFLKKHYITFFYCRLTHKYCKPYTCYIFANKEDKEKYCSEHNLKCDGIFFDDYMLIVEEFYPNLVGIRINNVVLVSSYVPKTIIELCNKAIDMGYKINFVDERNKENEN